MVILDLQTENTTNVKAELAKFWGRENIAGWHLGERTSQWDGFHGNACDLQTLFPLAFILKKEKIERIQHFSGASVT